MFITANNVAFFPEPHLVVDLNQKAFLNDSTYNGFIQGIEKENKKFKLEDIKKTANCYFDTDSIDIKRTFPIKTGISITSDCQLRCSYCAYESGSSCEELSLEQLKAYVDFIVKNALFRRKIHAKENAISIYFTGGGEPTLAWKKLTDTVNYIHELSERHNLCLEIGLTTNGILNAKKIEYIINHFNSVLVSFDGLPETQNANRKVGGKSDSFDIVNGTLYALDCSKTKYNIRTTVWEKDYDKMTQMAEFVFNTYKNVRKWEIEPVTPTGRAITELSNNCDNRYKTNNMLFVDNYIKLKEYCIQRGWGKRVNCSLFSDFNVTRNCGTAYGYHPWLSSNGIIVTCLDAKEKAPVLGKIEKNNVISYPCNDHLMDGYITNMSKSCNNCIASFFCGGGCPLKYWLSEQLLPWDCEARKYYWNKVIDTIANGMSIGSWRAQKTNIDGYDNIAAYKMYLMED